MIAPNPTLQDRFVAILPQIEDEASFAFRRFLRHERADLIAEVVAHAWMAFSRLASRGKDASAFPVVLAKYSVMAVRAGKLVGRRANRRDVTSPFRRKADGRRVLSIEVAPNEHVPAWKDILTETRLASPAETAASRIDFAGWLKLQNRRNRRIAESLVDGNRTLDVARRFKVSPGRISQIRDEFRKSWDEFHGDASERGRRAELAVA